jgi:hypothetical protein
MPFVDSLVEVPAKLHEEVAPTLQRLTRSQVKLRVNDKRVLELASRYGTLGVPGLGCSLLAWSRAALLAQVVPFYSYLSHLNDSPRQTDYHRPRMLEQRRQTRPGILHRALDQGVVRIRAEAYSVEVVLNLRHLIGSRGPLPVRTFDRDLYTSGKQLIVSLLEREMNAVFPQANWGTQPEAPEAGQLPNPFFTLRPPTSAQPFPWLLSTVYASLLLELYDIVISNHRVWECEGCNRLFTSRRPDQRHCNATCRKRAQRAESNVI